MSDSNDAQIRKPATQKLFRSLGGSRFGKAGSLDKKRVHPFQSLSLWLSP